MDDVTDWWRYGRESRCQCVWKDAFIVFAVVGVAVSLIQNVNNVH